MDRIALINDLVNEAEKNRIDNRKMADMVGPMQWLHEYCLVQISLGRAFGHTEYIKQYRTMRDLVITPDEHHSRSMMSTATDYNVMSATSVERNMRGRHGFPWQRVLVDASGMDIGRFQYIMDYLMETCRYAAATPLIVVLGRPRQ